MIVFGYSFEESPIAFVEGAVFSLRFCDWNLVGKEDKVVIFGVEHNGDNTFSLDNIANICERAGSVIFISSSSVYSTKLLFSHKEDDVFTSSGNKIEGVVNEVLEEIVITTTLDNNNRSCILRVDTIEDFALLDLIEKKADRGLYGSVFNRISVITLPTLFSIIEKIFSDIELHNCKAYNIAEKNTSEYSYYSSLSPLPVGHKIKFGNSALNTTRARKAGLL